MRRDKANLALNGRVSWGKEAEGPPPAPDDLPPGEPPPGAIVTDLKIAARGVPIDEDLLTALPAERRGVLQQIGISGVLDIDGRIYQGINARRSATPRSGRPGVPSRFPTSTASCS